MDLADKTKQLQKYEKKKKWEDAAKTAVKIADFYVDQKNYSESLKYFERAISARQKEKKAEAVIVLYRKIINVARRGRHKTQKELFRYTAAAIPIVEEYIRVLVENDEYITKNGALTRYFLGECREIVSGINQRNAEYLLAGKVFVEVGKKLASRKKTEAESQEAFEKARIIFTSMKSHEEIFEAFLVEADINIRKMSFDRGFYLFEEARNLFEDDTHFLRVLNTEKAVYSEIGLELFEKHYSNDEQRKFGEMLIARAKEAHLQAKSLNEVSTILFEIGRIYLEHDQLEAAFQTYNEAIENSQLVGDESVPQKIIEFLYREGKKLVDELFHQSSKFNFSDVDNLLSIKYFDQIIDICKKLGKGPQIEEVALFIRDMGKQLINQGLLSDDFPYISKAVEILISQSRFSGLHKIGDELEAKMDELLAKQQVFEAIKIQQFLVDSYQAINDKQSAGWVNVKLAEFYAKMRNHEQQLEVLQHAVECFQQVDKEALKAFSEILEVQFDQIKTTIFRVDFINILGNVYLLMKNSNKYDSLYSQQALYFLEEGEIDQALSLFNQNFEYLRRTENIPRAINRINTMIEKLFENQNYTYMMSLIHNQVNFLTQLHAEPGDIVKSVQRLETLIEKFFDKTEEHQYIEPVYALIKHMYDHIGLKEAQGDTAYEISTKYFEQKNIDQGFNYLGKSFQIFLDEGLLEKVGMILDYLEQKKNYYSEMEASASITDRFFEFFVSCLLKLNQEADAADLMLQRAIQLIPIQEELALDQFKTAKSIVSQIGLIGKVGEFEKAFGSTLLKHGKTDLGLQVLSETDQKSSVEALSIAATYLSSAEKHFEEKDYDTYFTLVDQALNTYIDLQMIQEASTIALSEARKLWSIKNVAYAMIFLERAWQTLASTYTVGITQSIQPLIDSLTDIIEDLFSMNKYDEALGFIDLQERIYKHINRPDMLISIANMKVKAHIGKGNYDGALSQITDVVSLREYENQTQEKINFVGEFLEELLGNIPERIKDLVTKYFQLLISNQGSETLIIQETIEKFSTKALNNLDQGRIDSFNLMSDLLFKALFDVEKADEIVNNFVTEVMDGLIARSKFSELSRFLEDNSMAITNLPSEMRYKIVRKFGSTLSSIQNLPEKELVILLTFLTKFSTDLSEIEMDSAATIIYDIGKAHRKKKDILQFAYDQAISLSKLSTKTTTTLGLLETHFRTEFEAENYNKALEIIDDTIKILESHFESREDAIRFVNLLEANLPSLGGRRKRKWHDQFTQKYQLFTEKFLGERDEDPSTEEEYSEKSLDEMIDSSTKKKE
jgi:tetratricopeptide (TPR) repeat protein